MDQTTRIDSTEHPETCQLASAARNRKRRKPHLYSALKQHMSQLPGEASQRPNRFPKKPQRSVISKDKMCAPAILHLPRYQARRATYICIEKESERGRERERCPTCQTEAACVCVCVCVCMLTRARPAPPLRSRYGLGSDGGTALAAGLDRLTALQTLKLRWPGGWGTGGVSSRPTFAGYYPG